MLLRLIRKSKNAIKHYGVKEFVRRVVVFFERKLYPSKYFHTTHPLKPGKKGKNVLFITGEPRNATSYYRCEIPKLQLELQGWTTDIIYEKFVDRIILEMQKKPKLNYSHIIFYRTPLSRSNEILIEMARERKIKTIFSIDDFLYRKDLLTELDYTKYLDPSDAKRFLERAEGMYQMMLKCDAAITSTEYISKVIKKVTKKPVFVNRNGIKEDYSDLLKHKRKKANSEKVVLGYFSGSETHDRDFSIVFTRLKRFLDTYKNTELWVGGHIKLDFKNERDEIKKFPFMPRAKFMELMLEVDINLLPLEYTEFNKGKSEIKFIEAALLEIPTVASAVGDLSTVIKHQETGFLVKKKYEWDTYLVDLINSQRLRLDIGRAARKSVLKNYNSEKLGKELVNFLNKL